MCCSCFNAPRPGRMRARTRSCGEMIGYEPSARATLCERCSTLGSTRTFTMVCWRDHVKAHELFNSCSLSCTICCVITVLALPGLVALLRSEVASFSTSIWWAFLPLGLGLLGLFAIPLRIVSDFELCRDDHGPSLTGLLMLCCILLSCAGPMTIVVLLAMEAYTSAFWASSIIFGVLTGCFTCALFGMCYEAVVLRPSFSEGAMMVMGGLCVVTAAALPLATSILLLNGSTAASISGLLAGLPFALLILFGLFIYASFTFLFGYGSS